MKKILHVLSEDPKGGNIVTTHKGRGKLVITSKSKDEISRPEFIEVDTFRRKATSEGDEPVIRVKFSDDAGWTGTMADLRAKLGV